ncbi:xanthine dehydrogenase family protein molybdopterin-binding subunit [Algoriphagus pacificus]|uniref:Xanthine dehydrogenase family protein molybdopterin-binding subunit n=1 Tax=Algoriphagus pacificus TaxID=2811234 RepID=A0ABS3CI82_9BACT|nr:molybdopterin cofactor-binding domain-containing protein [Algoriphagus pacificus]MBN7815349.1 xanthine dehydrogenase family protein molybdopterin-binding subunit [Algoriphagus pacificus]
MLPNIPFLKNKNREDQSKVFVPSRRDFLKIGSLATGGFLLGVNFQCSGPKGETITFAPNVYLSINSDNEVTIIAHRSEMGTGIRTSLPQIVADELGADWSTVKIVQAEGDEEKYGNQNTDGSFSVRMFYEPMRKAGATGRHMLISAAAAKWGVDASECDTENGMVVHAGSSKKIQFGELVESLKDAPMPAEGDIKLRDASSFKLIGTDVPIYDVKDITRGKAVFGADVDLPNMKIAVVKRTPVIGAKVISYNDEKALAVPGVVQVVKIEGSGFPPGLDKALEGVAVIAENTWAAIKGREALEVEWDLGENQSYNSAQQLTEMVQSTTKNGKVRRERGDFNSASRAASKVIERTYEAPFYAHATIEPPAAIAHVKEDGSCEVWAPTQHPQWARGAVAGALGIDVSQVKINVTLLGGGFGRKSKPDFVVEAATLSKAAKAPVRVQWTREDDLHFDFFHSHSAQRIKASLDSSGNLTGWNHHTVFPAIGSTSSKEELHPSDGEMGLGCVDFPFDVPNIRIESHESTGNTRVGWLRSVSNIHHAFAMHSMMDEIAEARGKDPIENALELLGEDRDITFQSEMVGGDYGNYGEKIEDFPWNTGRMKNVIREVASKSNWTANKEAGKIMGFAAHKSFLTYVACVVVLEKDSTGKISIPEVFYAVDCGVAVNTDRIRSQFEGGSQFATSLATTSAITFENGQVQQNNFDTYQIIRMPASPKKIHVNIIESQIKPTGVGEPPVPPFIPALANAMYRMNGERIYKLPFKV